MAYGQNACSWDDLSKWSQIGLGYAVVSGEIHINRCSEKSNFVFNALFSSCCNTCLGIQFIAKKNPPKSFWGRSLFCFNLDKYLTRFNHYCYYFELDWPESKHCKVWNLILLGKHFIFLFQKWNPLEQSMTQIMTTYKTHQTVKIEYIKSIYL